MTIEAGMCAWRMCLTAAFTARNVPVTLMSIVRFQNSRLISSIRAGPSKMPADTTNPCGRTKFLDGLVQGIFHVLFDRHICFDCQGLSAA